MSYCSSYGTHYNSEEEDSVQRTLSVIMRQFPHLLLLLLQPFILHSLSNLLLHSSPYAKIDSCKPRQVQHKESARFTNGSEQICTSVICVDTIWFVLNIILTKLPTNVAQHQHAISFIINLDALSTTGWWSRVALALLFWYRIKSTGVQIKYHDDRSVIEWLLLQYYTLLLLLVVVVSI